MYTKTCGQQQSEKHWCVKESPRTLLTDKFIRVKNVRTLSLKRNLFTNEKRQIMVLTLLLQTLSN